MKKVATLSMLSFCMFTNDSEGFSAPHSTNPQINSRVQTVRKAATIGDDDNINMKQRVASENFLEANKDTITEKGSRRKFFGQVVKGSIGVAGIAVAEHGLGCACAQCIAEFEHGVGCACTGCGQAAKMTKARFGVKAAMAYERDVGGEFASPDTKAFNIQARQTNARLEAEGFKLDTKEEEAKRLSDAFKSFSYDDNQFKNKSVKGTSSTSKQQWQSSKQ